MDVLGQLARLQRPRLLVMAARIGAQHYRRERHLRPLLGTSHHPRNAVALLRLSEIEAEMNARREVRNASYSVTKHLEVLTAMVGEARLMLRSGATYAAFDDQENASASAALRSATNASSASLIAGSIDGC